MYNENEISLTEATVLALQGKLKLEGTKPAKRSRRKIENKEIQEKEETKEIKEESVGIDTNNVTVSVDDNGNTTVETEKEVITVTEKDQSVEDIIPVEEPTEEISEEPTEIIDVPVEGNETIVPEEEVSEETIDEIIDEPEEDDKEVNDLDESKNYKKITENDALNSALYGPKYFTGVVIELAQNIDSLNGDTKYQDIIENEDNLNLVVANLFDDSEMWNTIQETVLYYLDELIKGNLTEGKHTKPIKGKSNKVCVEAIEDKEEIKCEDCKKEVCECTVKTETKPTFNKKSFEEALTKFYKFNSDIVESFKVESISRNKKGSIKIEGKLNDKVDTIMIFDKLTEGNSYITYKLRNTNGILKESKDIITSMFISKKFNNLNCRRIISK